MDVICLTDDADTFTGHVYLIRGAQPTLVDAGTMPGIVDAVREHGSDLDQVLLTHRHEDHVEQLPALRAAFDPTVYAADPGEDAVELEDGDTVTVGDGDLEAVATPGHAQDHLAFLGDEVLFSGDVVVKSDGAFDEGSFGRTDIPGADRETLIESLDRLLDRLPDTVEAMYPGHGPSQHGNVRAVIERARERAARREPKYD